MKATVKCKVPTTYQLNSFEALTGTCPNQSPGGGYYFEKPFPTVEDGKQFMRERAFSLLENDGFTNEEYRAAIRDINKAGTLRYDAAAMHLEKHNRP